MIALGKKTGWFKLKLKLTLKGEEKEIKCNYKDPKSESDDNKKFPYPLKVIDLEK